MNIQRVRFYTPENVPRQTREMVAMRNEVALSDKTLSALFKVDSPDPNDQAFLQGAKAIRTKHPSWTEEEVAIHFGRKQLTFSKAVNLGQQQSDLATKLAGLRFLTTQAVGDSKADENLMTAILRVLKTESLNTPRVKQEIQAALEPLDLPPLSVDAGLPQYVDKVDEVTIAFLLAKGDASFIEDRIRGDRVPLNAKAINQRLSKGDGMFDLDTMEILRIHLPSRSPYNLRNNEERKRNPKYEDAAD